MKNRFEKILKREPAIYSAVMEMPIHSDFELLAADVISPVLVMYTEWILQQAEIKKIKHLYFLARDGYLMYHIAKKICDKKKYSIKCSYFYCSRYALRMAAYRFQDETAYEKLFLHAFRQDPDLLLKRAGFTAEQKQQVYNDIGFSKEKEREFTGRKRFDEICGKIKKSVVFHRILTEKSDTAYENTMSYIRQEQMQSYDMIGIVDLGWTGSLQQTLYRLLNSENSSVKVYGFYMGMLNKPPETENSRYCTWLFGDKNNFIQSWFAHNLMECICSAPHGMTIGYEKSDGEIIPVFASAENEVTLAKRLRSYCEMLAEKSSYTYQTQDRKIALKLLKRMMFVPTEQECRTFEKYRFCDDVGEQYHRSIIQKGKLSDFNKELPFHKLFFRDTTDGFYWYYGSVQASNLIPKIFYRWTYLFTKYLIAIKKSR